MHHFITYLKRTGEVTGSFTASTNELLPNPPSPEHAIAEVTDPDQIKALVARNPRLHKVSGATKKGAIERLQLEPRFQGKVVLTTDAPDYDGDGLPELPADGRSSATLKVSLADSGGKPVGAAVEVSFTTTRGALARRRAETTEGKTQIAFTSAAETTRAHVKATAPGFEPASLMFEFIPVEEYQAAEAKSRKKK